jgi:hypothetical protein
VSGYGFSSRRFAASGRRLWRRARDIEGETGTPGDPIGRVGHEFGIGKCELEDGQHIFSLAVADNFTADDPNRLNRRSIANPAELLVSLTVV